MFGSQMPMTSEPVEPTSARVVCFSTGDRNLLLIFWREYRKCSLVWMGSPQAGIVGECAVGGKCGLVDGIRG